MSFFLKLLSSDSTGSSPSNSKLSQPVVRKKTVALVEVEETRRLPPKLVSRPSTAPGGRRLPPIPQIPMPQADRPSASVLMPTVPPGLGPKLSNRYGTRKLPEPPTLQPSLTVENVSPTNSKTTNAERRIAELRADLAYWTGEAEAAESELSTFEKREAKLIALLEDLQDEHAELVSAIDTERDDWDNIEVAYKDQYQDMQHRMDDYVEEFERNKEWVEEFQDKRRRGSWYGRMFRR